MSEQQAPEHQDTPAVAGPEGTPGTAEEQQLGSDPYEKRYNDLRPQFDRTTQRLSELENREQWFNVLVTAEDTDTRRQAAEALGFDIPDEIEDVEPVEYDDPYDELRAELNELRDWRDQTTQSAQEQQQGELITALTSERLGQIEGLAKEDQDMVLAYAINALPPVREPGVPVPLPDVQGAFEYFQARETERQKSWASTKRAPYVSPGGRPANEVPDPGTGHNARMNRAMQAVHEEQQG